MKYVSVKTAGAALVLSAIAGHAAAESSRVVFHLKLRIEASCSLSLSGPDCNVPGQSLSLTSFNDARSVGFSPLGGAFDTASVTEALPTQTRTVQVRRVVAY